ncbi:unnamed protein product, partial [Medioppia subpectinata]
MRKSEDVSKRNHISISDEKFESLVDTLFNMIDRYHEKRPTSADIQALIHNWTVDAIVSAWIEDNKFIYILMQYCDHNLRTILNTKMTLFRRQSSEALIGPPIIHRDLKPENILVNDHNPKGWFVKISDFGVSIFDESSSQSHTHGAGTEKYMAPEVNSPEVSKRNHIAISDQKYQSLANTFLNMIDNCHNNRPTSADIQALIHNWTVDAID